VLTNVLPTAVKQRTFQPQSAPRRWPTTSCVCHYSSQTQSSANLKKKKTNVWTMGVTEMNAWATRWCLKASQLNLGDARDFWQTVLLWHAHKHARTCV
jgi:hypothetical protein